MGKFFNVTFLALILAFTKLIFRDAPELQYAVPAQTGIFWNSKQKPGRKSSRNRNFL